MQPSDLFLLGLFVQDVLGREEAPGLELPEDESAPGPGRPRRPGSVSELDGDTFYNTEEGAADPASGGEDWADARSTASPVMPDGPGGEVALEDYTLRPMRREAVFLHTPQNNYAPYVMHCAEVAPSIALVVISEGQNAQLSDLMHLALKSLNNILEMGVAAQRRQRNREVAAEIPSRIHMAVRGGTGQAMSHAQINGNFHPLPDPIDGRPAYQRTSLDMYLFYNELLEAWCMGQDLPRTTDPATSGSGTVLDTAALAAMVTDTAHSPENIRGVWEVFDHDLREFHSDPYLQIRCVRGDGALRNRDGRWAKQSTNGLFYCEGVAQCLCGGCNGYCGPVDGCNCTSCKLLDGSRGYGALELALMLHREQELAKASAAESEKALRKESEVIASTTRKICQIGANLIPQQTADQLLRRVGRLLQIVASKRAESRRWVSVSELAEGLARSLRTNVGERIARSNHVANDTVEARMVHIQEQVASVLKDYIDFLHVKIHRNVTMTAYVTTPKSFGHRRGHPARAATHDLAPK